MQPRTKHVQHVGGEKRRKQHEQTVNISTNEAGMHREEKEQNPINKEVTEHPLSADEQRKREEIKGAIG